MSAAPVLCARSSPGHGKNPGRQPLGRTEEVGEDSYAARRNRSMAAVLLAKSFSRARKKAPEKRATMEGKRKRSGSIEPYTSR